MTAEPARASARTAETLEAAGKRMSRRTTKATVGLLAVVAALLLSAAVVHSDSQREYQVKAAFLYNFAKFVEWPAGSFARADAPLRFCIVGQDPFGDTLGDTVEGRTVGGRAIVVEHASVDESSHRCQLVFVEVEDEGELAHILHNFARVAVLTVGESPEFLEAGGIIRLLVEANKVRFDVDVTAAEQAGLKVSSQLLKLARTVRK